jgi:FHA domain
MSLETHADRVHRALGARGQGELDALVADLRPRGPLRRAAMSVISGWSLMTADLRSAWERPHIPALALPAATTAPLVLGRARDCDCVIAEPSVSRYHAELRRQGERWLLRDLGSRNGTRVNGMRVLEEVEVRPGDRVSLGEARYRLALRP